MIQIKRLVSHSSRAESGRNFEIQRSRKLGLLLMLLLLGFQWGKVMVWRTGPAGVQVRCEADRGAFLQNAPSDRRPLLLLLNLNSTAVLDSKYFLGAPPVGSGAKREDVVMVQFKCWSTE
jgi:hypothetical protein